MSGNFSNLNVFECLHFPARSAKSEYDFLVGVEENFFPPSSAINLLAGKSFLTFFTAAFFLSLVT